MQIDDDFVTSDDIFQTLSRLLESAKAFGVGGRDYRILEIAMRHWYRYFAFLKIAAARFEQAADEYASSHHPGAGIRVHHEVDTFYLFASILLDRIAMTFSYFFWFQTNWEHRTMHQRLSTACPWATDCSQLQRLADELHNDIADYRNYLVVHVKELRLEFAILSGALIRVAPVLSEATSDDFHEPHKRQLSGDLPAMLKKIRRYVAEIASFMVKHADNSRIVRQQANRAGKDSLASLG
jgi:hypothetical protein